MNQEKIGKFIAELRKERKMTQEDLAKELLTVRETVSKWERGIYIPSNEMLMKLGSFFDVSINEIFYGERKNQYNDKKIDSVPLNIMRENKKKFRKLLIFSTTTIILLVISFLTYYFLNNYNSIHVYKIYGSSDDISLNDGLMIVSKEKGYIQLGNIDNYSKNDIEKVRLFFKKNGQENNIYIDFNNVLNHLLINNFNYNELFKYSDLKNIINNLYLEITFTTGNDSVIKLNLEKDFSNNKIFDDNSNSNIDDKKQSENKNLDIPKYIEENFEFNKELDEYYLKTERSDMIIDHKFNVETNLYTIEEIQQNSKISHYDYFLLDNSLMYYQLNNDNIENNFTFELTNKQCIYGQCDLKIVEYFQKNYLKNLK